jgi:hypothetical protein
MTSLMEQQEKDDIAAEEAAGSPPQFVSGHRVSNRLFALWTLLQEIQKLRAIREQEEVIPPPDTVPCGTV